MPRSSSSSTSMGAGLAADLADFGVGGAAAEPTDERRSAICLRSGVGSIGALGATSAAELSWLLVGASAAAASAEPMTAAIDSARLATASCKPAKSEAPTEGAAAAFLADPDAALALRGRPAVAARPRAWIAACSESGMTTACARAAPARAPLPPQTHRPPSKMFADATGVIAAISAAACWTAAFLADLLEAAEPRDAFEPFDLLADETLLRRATASPTRPG